MPKINLELNFKRWEFVKIKKYISNWKVDINKKYSNWNTLLHLAAWSCNSNLVKFLLKNWANVRIKNNDWITPFLYNWTKYNDLYSCFNDFLYILKILNKYWSNVNEKDLNWNTIIQRNLSSIYWSDDLLELITIWLKLWWKLNESNKRNENVLMSLINSKFDDSEIYDFVLEHLKKVDVNQKDIDWNTILHYLIKTWKRRVAEKVIKKWWDINLKNNNWFDILNYLIREINERSCCVWWYWKWMFSWFWKKEEILFRKNFLFKIIEKSKNKVKLQWVVSMLNNYNSDYYLIIKKLIQLKKIDLNEKIEFECYADTYYHIIAALLCNINKIPENVIYLILDNIEKIKLDNFQSIFRLMWIYWNLKIIKIILKKIKVTKKREKMIRVWLKNAFDAINYQIKINNSEKHKKMLKIFLEFKNKHNL